MPVDETDHRDEIGGIRVERARQKRGANPCRGKAFYQGFLKRREIQGDRGLLAQFQQGGIAVLQDQALPRLRGRAGGRDQVHPFVEGALELYVGEVGELVAQPSDRVLEQLVMFAAIADVLEQVAHRFRERSVRPPAPDAQGFGQPMADQRGVFRMGAECVLKFRPQRFDPVLVWGRRLAPRDIGGGSRISFEFTSA